MSWALICILSVGLSGPLLGRFLKVNSSTEFGEPNFDPEHCFKIIMCTASVCVVLVIIETLILALADPTGRRCPDWNISPSAAEEPPRRALSPFLSVFRQPFGPA
jgi:hypothetical protein